MASSKNHVQMVTHAHILLLGFAISFVCGVCQKLWLTDVPGALARLQFYLHQIGAVVLLIRLFLMFGQSVEEKILGPILGMK
ncbi:MAG: hypothetical protein C9356_11020 [Oleiphilus sp.]|nr:MAG: hypothetical protein C9356_11020 [Oleiphilus sp.]